MSIYETVDALIREEKLFVHRTPVGQPAMRALYLTAELKKELENPRSSLHFHRQVPGVVAMFDRWTTGSLMKIRLDGKGKGAFLALLAPPPADVWELRIVEPRPQVRIFVRFLQPDVMVAFHARNRDLLGDRLVRSAKRSENWAEAMFNTDRDWKILFGNVPPFTGGGAASYITENFDECP